MSNPVKIALSLAMVWAILKMVFYITGYSEIGFNVGALSHFSFIIIAASLTLWYRFKKIKRNDSDTITDFTLAAKSAMLYVIFAHIFSFLYYKTIDAQFLDNRADARIEQMYDFLSNGDEFNKLKAVDDHILEETTLDQHMEFLAKNTREQISVKFVVFYGFTLWVFVSMVSAMVITFLFRQILLK